MRRFLFIILSVAFFAALENLYCQYTEITQDDIIIEKLLTGYQINIRKKNNIDNIRLLFKLPNNKYSYLYLNQSSDANSLININKVSVNSKLGTSLQASIGESVYLDTNNVNARILLTDNTELVLEALDNNGNIVTDSTFLFKIDNNKKTNPIITLRNVQKEGNLYAFYLYYSGGENGKYAFYVREGLTNTTYKLIKTSFNYALQADNNGIILEDTYNSKIGKQLYIKAYFKELPEDRYLSFNVFNTKGETFTYPIDYIIQNQTIKNTANTVTTEENINVPPVIEPPNQEIIELNTNEMIVSKKQINNNNIERNFFDGEAIDSLNKASELKSHYADDEKDLNSQIYNIIKKYNSAIDLVLVLDTTESMDPYLISIKEEIKSISKEVFKKDVNSRIGFLLYRDVGDAYLTKKIDFDNNINKIHRDVNYFYAKGGGDKSEPMYEAIQKALEDFDYKNESKVVIVITDAPAKIIGKANADTNKKTAKEKNIKIEYILVKEIKRNTEDIEKPIF
ncbi:vWA domain-containing protein [Brachyspira pilosicoli]|uniref:VWA domain-containing protein n=1 Tax=Brachyspira pilosicoli TaxID=52584 RepID=A0A5C8EJW4_BRAPL|nr:vWA domain-containing protein [Brachyspira pilosicoli]TXJ37261.1 VWA domain-containing protein [Brachyspira pilosicoli]